MADLATGWSSVFAEAPLRSVAFPQVVAEHPGLFVADSLGLAVVAAHLHVAGVVGWALG